MNPILRAESIGKRFRGRSVLASAFLEARCGTVTALLGRNGAGKSTLLRIAAGWLGADYGSVEFRGRRRRRAAPAALASAGMCFLPVDRSLLDPSFTLVQHLDAVRYRYGGADPLPLLARLGLADRASVPCRSLSSGERRRAELALALFRRPLCLLLDEPLRGIDPRDTEMIAAKIRAVADAGCAVVVTGHEVRPLLELADAVTWVSEGSTRMLGTPAQAVGDWHFTRGFLGGALPF